MDGVRLQTKVRWILIDFSKNKPYILSCKHLHINMLMKNNLYIRLSLVFTLFHPVRNSGKPPRLPAYSAMHVIIPTIDSGNKPKKHDDGSVK